LKFVFSDLENIGLDLNCVDLQQFKKIK